MRKRVEVGLLVALLGLMVTQGGCNLFAGAASMRIEVEVYKGPLSKEPEIQLIELSGLLTHNIQLMQATKAMIESFAENGEVFQKKKGPSDWHNCDLEWRFFPIIDRGNCLILSHLYEDANDIEQLLELAKTKIDQIDPAWIGQQGFNQFNFRTDVIETLLQTAKASAQASAKAFGLTIGSITGVPINWHYRIPLVHFIVASSEIGKQLSARADSLLKQMDGLDRRELPLSAQLRETDATEFLQLYDWLDAHPGNYLAGVLQPGTALERTKAVRRLFADHHWSNINTVYASGWGKGSMALIKDDIGNWNLKSFDSDPEDLLRAYKDAAITAVETAAKAAKAGFSGGGSAAADKLLEVAAQYFSAPSGTSGTVSGTDQYRLLRERISLQLQSLISDKKSQDTQVATEYQEAVKTLKGMKPSDSEHAAQEKAVQALKDKLIVSRMETIRSIEKLLNEHSELTDLLAKGTISE